MENKKGIIKLLVERSKAKTPRFFKKMRIIGLSLAAAGGVLVAAPIALPAAIVAVGGYLIAAGSVATAVSQVAVQHEECGDEPTGNGADEEEL